MKKQKPLTKKQLREAAKNRTPVWYYHGIEGDRSNASGYIGVPIWRNDIGYRGDTPNDPGTSIEIAELIINGKVYGDMDQLYLLSDDDLTVEYEGTEIRGFFKADQ
jgi:hypothetical protein